MGGCGGVGGREVRQFVGNLVRVFVEVGAHLELGAGRNAHKLVASGVGCGENEARRLVEHIHNSVGVEVSLRCGGVVHSHAQLERAHTVRHQAHAGRLVELKRK